MREEEMYSVLESMNMPIIYEPEGIMDIINQDRRALASIQDPRHINDLMIGFAQFMMYARQQYNIYRATAARLKRLYEQNVIVAAHSEKEGKSLAERKSLAIKNNAELQQLQEDLDVVELKKSLIEDWVDDCKEFLNALKRIHDDLIDERQNQYRTVGD